MQNFALKDSHQQLQVKLVELGFTQSVSLDQSVNWINFELLELIGKYCKLIQIQIFFCIE